MEEFAANTPVEPDAAEPVGEPAAELVAELSGVRVPGYSAGSSTRGVRLLSGVRSDSLAGSTNRYDGAYCAVAGGGDMPGPPIGIAGAAPNPPAAGVAGRPYSAVSRPCIAARDPSLRNGSIPPLN